MIVLLYILAYFAQKVEIFPPLLAEEKVGSEIWLLHPWALEKCTADEKTLAVDYSMHPYYLRVDLDGDEEMEYVVNLLDSSGWERRGLMVCHEDGTKTIYRGIADRKMSAEEKDRIGRVEGILKDAVLIEEQTSEEALNSVVDRNYSPISDGMLKYNVRKCCDGKGGNGGQLIFTKIISSQTIPLCEVWYPLSSKEVISRALRANIIDGSEEIVGEGIITVCHMTYTLGFIQEGEFRWFIQTYADPN